MITLTYVIIFLSPPNRCDWCTGPFVGPGIRKVSGSFWPLTSSDLRPCFGDKRNFDNVKVRKQRRWLKGPTNSALNAAVLKSSWWGRDVLDSSCERVIIGSRENKVSADNWKLFGVNETWTICRYIQIESKMDRLKDGRCRKEIHPSHRESGCGRSLK